MQTFEAQIEVSFEAEDIEEADTLLEELCYGPIAEADFTTQLATIEETVED